MQKTSIVAVMLFVLASAPAAAFQRGDVIIETRTNSGYQLWGYSADLPRPYGLGFLLIVKPVPYYGSGHFLAPSPNQIVFAHDRTIAFWDGRMRYIGDPEPAYTDVFSVSADPGDIAPMRSGNFLVAQHGSLLEFNARGVVAQHRLPGSASHIELLADQCTLLYSAGNRVAQFNVCTNEPMPDFVALRDGAEAGAIRQLPNGDVLVADGVAVERFTQDGSLLSVFPFIGVTHIALSVDGLSFWAAGVDGGVAYLRHFQLDTTAAETIPLDDGPLSMTSIVPFAIDDLVVVGEWRASAAAGRRRATSPR